MKTAMMDLTLRCPMTHPWYTDEALQKLTFPEYILQEAEEYLAKSEDPNQPYTIDAETGEEIPFSQFKPLSGNTASWFYSQGMRKGDVVIYMVRKMAKLSVFQTGVWRANGILRASYPQDLPDVIAERIIESKVKWIYCDTGEVGKCREAIGKCPWDVQIIVNGQVDGCVSIDDIFRYEGQVPQIEVTPNDPALILLTSGTTGKSKGAVRTHKALVCLIFTWNLVGGAKRYLAIAAATHVSAISNLFTCIGLGATLLPLHITEPDFILQAIHKYRPTTVTGFPGYFVDALASPNRKLYDLSSVNLFTTGGVMVSEALKQKLRGFENVKDVLVHYGATESVLALGNARFLNAQNGYTEQQEQHIGRAVPGGEVKILDLETGEALGPNQKGEICVKSIDMISEYLNDPVKTAEAFTPDGFIKMGDLCSYDETGMVSIYGRTKEVFKYFNNHIPPDHIDNVVASHPAVHEACTIGIPDGLNFVPRTFVVLKEKQTATSEELIQFANEKLPDYMHLRGGLRIVDNLPRGDTGKIPRRLVAQLWQ